MNVFLVSAGKLYGKKDYVEERHRHRYEVNPKYVKELEEKGLKFVGHSTDGQRMEIMELKGMRADQASCYCVLQFIVNKFCFCNVSITLGNLQASVIGLLQNKICQLCCGSPRSINRFQRAVL